jgi:hypothetical protein
MQRNNDANKEKIYFHFILDKKNYIEVDENHMIENLALFLGYRTKEKIILLSSNFFRVISALSEGY